MINYKILLLFIFFSVLSSQYSAAACQQEKINQQARVTRVIDGDTLQIDNGSRIRLIGVNTPEIGRRGKASEPGAEEAKKAVQHWLASSANRVNIQFGQERRDRYRRSLAHVFLQDGRNITELLLLSGHGLHVAYPPNLWALDCYRASEARARRLNNTHWSNKVTSVNQVMHGKPGFQLVRGKVADISFSKKSIWLNFSPQFAIRIARRDLRQFKAINLKQLLHKTLLVRGWTTQQKNKRILRLRHSSMLEIVK